MEIISNEELLSSPISFLFKMTEFISSDQAVRMSVYYTGVDDMVEDESRCNWCGGNISGTAKNCPKCGKPVAAKLAKREFSGIKKQKGYSGVFQQQGRMLTDSDWTESVRITKTR